MQKADGICLLSFIEYDNVVYPGQEKEDKGNPFISSV